MNPENKPHLKSTAQPSTSQWEEKVARLEENIKNLEEKKKGMSDSLQKKRKRIEQLRKSSNKRISFLLGLMIIEAIKKKSIHSSVISKLIITHITNKAERDRLRNTEIFPPEDYAFLYSDNKTD